jgi:hypothetical protein
MLPTFGEVRDYYFGPSEAVDRFRKMGVGKK